MMFELQSIKHCVYDLESLRNFELAYKDKLAEYAKEVSKSSGILEEYIVQVHQDSDYPEDYHVLVEVPTIEDLCLLSERLKFELIYYPGDKSLKIYDDYNE